MFALTDTVNVERRRRKEKKRNWAKKEKSRGNICVQVIRVRKKNDQEEEVNYNW